jgi:coproporphyrinogen III oxidase
MEDLKRKKTKTEGWFKELRNQFCIAFSDLDGCGFERKKWKHKGSGGGETSIMKGNVFEKVGVNISTVSGRFSNEFKKTIKGAEHDPSYWATGLSLVAHMQSPIIPAFHFNTRFLVTTETWFGGGADMTPTFINEYDKKYFHSKMEEACDNHNEKYYKEFKKNCDKYFYLPHRDEPRGVGGIFFDHLNTGNWGKDFSFVKEVGEKTLEAIVDIVKANMGKPWTKKQKEKQEIKRGRYVEFNLIWDRGTLFGLKTGGSTEAILMSMPPTAKWA